TNRLITDSNFEKLKNSQSILLLFRFEGIIIPYSFATSTVTITISYIFGHNSVMPIYVIVPRYVYFIVFIWKIGYSPRIGIKIIQTSLRRRRYYLKLQSIIIII